MLAHPVGSTAPPPVRGVPWVAVAALAWGIASAAVAQQRPSSPPAQPAASARDEEARNLFEAARAAYEEGRYEEALERFEESYRLSARPGLLYNIGQTAERLRRDERAIEAYEAYLAAAPDAPNAAAVQRRIEILREQLAVARSLRQPTEDVTETWWFWTLVGGGAAVVVAAIAIGVAVGTSSPGVQDPLPVGPVVMTLELRP